MRLPIVTVGHMAMVARSYFEDGTFRDGNRATAMLSVASIVSALFGTNLLQHHHSEPIDAVIGVALWLFAISALLAVKIVSLKDVNVGVDTAPLVTRAQAEPAAEAAVMSLTLARPLQDLFSACASL
jgi:hypothetical protein